MTNTYLTGNPLGSTAVKDLYDNASNFDDAMNSPSPAFTDRFGKRRETWAGMEQAFDDFLVSSGYEFIGDYDADGPLTITQANQIFSKDGEYWRPSPSLTLPYTTVNNWVTDQPKFVSVGDAALRQDLANGTSYLVDSRIVGFEDPLAPSNTNAASDMFGMQPVSAFRFIPVALHADIVAGTSTTDVHTYLNDALALGVLLHCPQGKYRIGGTLTMVQGGGIVGEGEKTQFIRNFTGGQVIRHPGGNQLGSPIILRDFCIIKDSAITVADGDTGIDIGYATAWGGRGDISNLLIMQQWVGFQWRGGTDGPMSNIHCYENFSHGFVGLNPRGRIVRCLSQYNGASKTEGLGHGYFMYSDVAGETGVVFESSGTFCNYGFGFLADSAPGVASANMWGFGSGTSFDRRGGVRIGDNTFTQFIWRNSFIEHSGHSGLIRADYPNYPDAHGIAVLAGVTVAELSGLQILNNSGTGLLVLGAAEVGVNDVRSRSNTGYGVQVSSPASQVDLSVVRTAGNVAGDISIDAGTTGTLRNARGGTIGIGYSPSLIADGVSTTTPSVQTVASAGTVQLPNYGEMFNVSGSTGITSITPSWAERRVTLRFLGVLTVTDGGDLQLAGNFVSTVGSTLSLVCDGTNWSEVGRAVI